MKKFLLICGGLLTLSACEGTRETLGLESEPPDEFAVVKRAPLELPPDYYLRPPRPGAQRPQELQTDEQARQTVFGSAPVSQEEERVRPLTTGEAIILQKTNAANIDPNIREKIDAETADLEEDSLPGVDKIKKFVGQDVEPKAEVVDPVKETERLKENAAKGAPVTEGETPTLER